MHELSIIANLFEIMEDKAKEKEAKRIVSVKLKIGALSGVVPELLRSAFDMYKKDTIAEEAEVDIETVPLKVLCRDCSRITSTSEDFVLTCSHCGSSNIKTTAGTDMFLEKMELEI
jgi:hydrogenase nickel incorporation protein HypA/HybF